MLKKTIYNGIYRPNFKGDVLFVGFNRDEGIYPWLNNAVSFAGYERAYIKESASLAEEYLSEYSKDDTRICIVKARYGYNGVTPDDFKNFLIPQREIKYCTLEGLSYYEKRKRQPEGYMQGFQFIRKVADKFPNIHFAVYGEEYLGIQSQAKQMKVDFIPKLYDDVFVPFTILEYLRNQNNFLFERGQEKESELGSVFGGD